MKRLLLVCLFLTGCTGSCMRWNAAVNGYTKLCIDGVSWLFIHGDYAQVQVGLDGKPLACQK